MIDDFNSVLELEEEKLFSGGGKQWTFNGYRNITTQLQRKGLGTYYFERFDLKPQSDRILGDRLGLPTNATPVVKEDVQEQGFVPSDKLLDFVRRGVVYYSRRHDGPDALGGLKRYDTAAFKQEFTRILQGMIVRELYKEQDYFAKSVRLFDGTGFFGTVEVRITDEFAIRPADSGAFLNTLASELSAYFAAGGIVEADWGRICWKDGTVVAELQPDDEIVPPEVFVEELFVEL